MIAALFALLTPVAACDVADAEKELRTMHAAVIARHLDGDVDSWMASEADRVFVSSRGELTTSGPERAERRREYLGSTQFDTYRDMVEPIVRVSDDCSLGWVMVQVEASGAQKRGPVLMPFQFQSSWIELYERHDGAWRGIGNASNFADLP
jgi:hypothetical protein